MFGVRSAEFGVMEKTTDVGQLIEAVRKKRIGVLMGGLSSEREVSLKTGGAVLEALLGRGFDAVRLDAGPDLAAGLRAERIEVVFNACTAGSARTGRFRGFWR
jgi:D-alanine-D-alanine ligase